MFDISPPLVIVNADDFFAALVGYGLIIEDLEEKLATNKSNRTQAEADLLRLLEKIIQESGNNKSFNANSWLKRWLSSPNPALNSSTPNSYLDTPEGRSLVAGLLQKMQSGTFA